MSLNVQQNANRYGKTVWKISMQSCKAVIPKTQNIFVIIKIIESVCQKEELGTYPCSSVRQSFQKHQTCLSWEYCRGTILWWPFFFHRIKRTTLIIFKSSWHRGYNNNIIEENWSHERGLNIIRSYFTLANYPKRSITVSLRSLCLTGVHEILIAFIFK